MTYLSNNPPPLNLPNLISVARFISVPIMLWLILTERQAAAFWLFLVAGISDAVDGFIAKRWNAVTALGGYLDAIADKALLAGVFVALGIQGELPIWLVVLVGFRDLSIAGGWMLLICLSGPRRVRPSFISKLNTVAQIILAVLILGGAAFGLVPVLAITIFIYVVTVTTVLSGIGYGLMVLRAGPDLEALP